MFGWYFLALFCLLTVIIAELSLLVSGKTFDGGTALMLVVINALAGVALFSGIGKERSGANEIIITVAGAEPDDESDNEE